MECIIIIFDIVRSGYLGIEIKKYGKILMEIKYKITLTKEAFLRGKIC